MAFTDEQRKALTAKLSFRHVKTRSSNGVQISYVEGWHAVSEANRIFGPDGWDRTTVTPRCLWNETLRGGATCFYTAKVRITVRAGGATIIREGIGTGFGRSSTPELAHEIALKAAETDGTKRALATFGNPFGLALYDKSFGNVTRKPSKRQELGSNSHSELVLYALDKVAKTFTDPEAFISAAIAEVAGIGSIDDVYAFWESNLPSLKSLRDEGASQEAVDRVVSTLKARARALGQSTAAASRNEGGLAANNDASSDNDASNHPNGTSGHGPGLAIPKVIRRRDKAHLAFVARQPCILCGRRPSHAHHLRFAQTRALGLKVSDEFTVPLCAVHHDALHRVGNEKEWWARHRIPNPLQIAGRLWAASRAGAHRDDDAPLDALPDLEAK